MTIEHASDQAPLLLEYPRLIFAKDVGSNPRKIDDRKMNDREMKTIIHFHFPVIDLPVIKSQSERPRVVPMPGELSLARPQLAVDFCPPGNVHWYGPWRKRVTYFDATSGDRCCYVKDVYGTRN